MVTLEPKPGPASLALTSWVPAPVPLPVGPVPRVPMPVGPERSVPMPVGPVRQDTGSTGFQWQASSDKLSKSLEKTMSGNSEKIAIDDWMPSGLDEFVKLHLHHACATGFLLQDEQSALQQTLPLQGLNPEEQRLVTQKFLSPSYDEFRSIVNKWSWLQRCMEYCGSSSKKSERIVAGSPQERLLLALNEHALRESALSDECWTTFEMVHPPLQDMVVQAVAASLPMKTAEDLSQHFVHLALNEESIYNLEAREKEQPIVTQESWEAYSDSQYNELLRRLLFNRNAEMSVLQLLSKEAPGNKATPSLLHVHLATREARRGCSAEVFSLLHAAAACGLSRLCARFLAEGLDVNERTGHQHFSPLHLAASNGKVRATMTLLASGAFPWMLDQSGKTPLYHVVKSLPESSTAKQTMLLQICQLLVFGMLQASDEELPFVESALEILQQVQLSWLLQLHHRMRNIQNLNPGVFTPKILVELAQMHYENLNMFLSFFDGDEDFRDEPVEKLSLSRQRRWLRRSRTTEQLMQEAEALAAAASKLPASEAKRSKRPRSKGRKKDCGLDLVVIHRSGALWPLDPEEQKAWAGTALDLDGEVFLPPQPA